MWRGQTLFNVIKCPSHFPQTSQVTSPNVGRRVSELTEILFTIIYHFIIKFLWIFVCFVAVLSLFLFFARQWWCVLCIVCVRCPLYVQELWTMVPCEQWFFNVTNKSIKSWLRRQIQKFPNMSGFFYFFLTLCVKKDA